MTLNEIPGTLPLATPAGRRWLGLAVVLAALLLSALACSAGTDDIGRLHLARILRLEAGAPLAGDDIVLAYRVEFKPGSTVQGDVTVTAYRAHIAGTIEGNLLVVADRLELGPGAQISGDVTACVNTFRRAPEAHIGGELRQECADDNSVSATQAVESGWEAWRNSVFFRFSTVLGGGLLFGALAALGAVLFPRRLVRMSEALQQAPLTAAGAGLLTIIVVVGLTVLYGLSLRLLVTLVLLPLVMLAWAFLVLLSLLGWMALARPFGVWLFRRVGLENYPAMIPAAIGGLVLALLLRVWSLFWFTAWLGLAVTILVAGVGLGAVILTRAGAAPYARR